MKNAWKKTAAFVLAFTLVAAPLTQTAGKDGLFGGAAITAKAAPPSESDLGVKMRDVDVSKTETLLTTITPTGKTTYSETTSGVVNVTPTNVTTYNSTYGWLWYGEGSLSVTAKEGYTITKCVFIQNNKTPITDTAEPFYIHTERDGITEDPNHDMDGVTSIEVYGYANPTTTELTTNNITIADFTYDGDDKTPVLKYKNGETETVLNEGTDYELVTTEGDTASAKDAGEYKIHVKGKGNYTGDNIALTWKINKASLDLTGATLTYNGGAQNLISGTVPTGTKFTLTEPKAGLNFAEEQPKISDWVNALSAKEDAASAASSFEEEDYYDNAANALAKYTTVLYWLSENDESEAAHYISRALNYVGYMAQSNVTPSPDVEEAINYINTYIKDTTLEKTKARFDTVVPEWNDTITATNAGTYTVYYKGSGNYDDTVKSVTATIEKAVLTDGNITIADFTYDGDEKTPVLKYGETELKDTDYELVTTDGDTASARDAGEYKIHINGIGNYKGTNIALTWKINKASFDLTGETLTYNRGAQNLISGDVPTGTKFKLTAPQAGLDCSKESTKISGWMSALDDKASDASSPEEGEYYAYASDALFHYDNAIFHLDEESEAADELSKAVRSAGEMAQDFTPSADVTEAIEYINTYIKDTTLEKTRARFDTVETVVADWSETKPTATNAGTYTVYYKGSGNYDDTEKSVTATIKQAVPAVVMPANLTAEYGQTLAKVTLPTAENGKWAWDAPATSVGDVGDHTFSATFTPNDTNYSTYTTDLTVNVKAISVTPATPTAVGTLDATYGQTLKDVALPAVEDGSGSWAWKDAATTSVGNAGEHTFTAVFTPSSPNYTAVEQDVTVNVAKADPTPAAFDALTATYGSTLADITLPKGWAWKDDTLSVGDVGQKTFGATYTPADTNNYNVIEGGVQINVVAVDKTSLNDAITAANTYLAKIQTTVYADPALALSSAITDAKTVAENDNVTEEQVAQAIKAVNNAVTTAQDAVKDIDDTKAAQAVTDQINALPAVENIKSTDKEAVEAARAAYANLKEAQAKVETAATDKLAAAEKAVADHIAADAVIEKINAIGTVALTDGSKEKIDAARAAYDALSTEDQKALVSNYTTLTADEQEYSNLQVADAEAKINAIGKVELTDAIKEKIDTARTAYDALSADQQALVKNAVALGYAEDLYKALEDKKTAEDEKAQAEADAAKKVAAAQEAQKAAEKSAQEAADKAAAAEKAKKDAEDALAKHDADAAEKVAAAQEAQKAAEEAQAKADADKAIADQAAQDAAEAQEEAKAAADQAAADKVIEKINAIGTVKKTNESENAIIAARSAYDTLTDDQKALVTNYDVLTAAESKYDTLPQTGMSGFHKVFAGLAALMGITGIGLVKRSRKEDEED